MIVRLTHAGGRAVIGRVPELHATYMAEHRTPYGRKSHDYEMPAIAWRQVLDALLADAFGPRGGQREDRPESLYTAMKRIQAAVSMREHHPALRGEAVQGHSAELIPVWKDGGQWSPYPLRLRGVYVSLPHVDEGVRYHVLQPVWNEINGHAFTEWIPRKYAPEWTGNRPVLRLNEHLKFVSADPGQAS